MIPLAELTRLVVELALPGEDPGALDPDDLLFENGILDSLSILQVIPRLEERLGIRIPHGEISAENFKTVRCLGAFLKARESAWTALGNPSGE